MSQTIAIHIALKRLIRSKGHSYAHAAKVLDLSEASVKRLFSRAQLSLERIELLSAWLGVDVAEVVALATEERALVTALTAAQEEVLLGDLSLLLTAFLLLNGWRDAQIRATYRLSEPELFHKLVQLEKLGLIELLPFSRVRLRTARNFSWRKNGPIQRYFAAHVLPEFLNTAFDQPGERMDFVSGMLSRASVHRMHELMRELSQRLDEMVQADLVLPVDERFGVSLMIALRPWEYHRFTQLRREPRTKAF